MREEAATPFFGAELPRLPQWLSPHSKQCPPRPLICQVQVGGNKQSDLKPADSWQNFTWWLLSLSLSLLLSLNVTFSLRNPVSFLTMQPMTIYKDKTLLAISTSSKLKFSSLMNISQNPTLGNHQIIWLIALDIPCSNERIIIRTEIALKCDKICMFSAAGSWNRGNGFDKNVTTLVKFSIIDIENGKFVAGSPLWRALLRILSEFSRLVSWMMWRRVKNNSGWELRSR